MFNLEITLEQKRWGLIPAPNTDIEYHTRTRVTGLAVEDSSSEGSVSVQKEMMLSAFPAGQVLEFKDGILQELYRGSVRPYTAEKKIILYEYEDGTKVYAVLRAVNDTTQLMESAGDAFTNPCTVTLDNFTEDGFDWQVVIATVGVISGTVLYADAEAGVLLFEGDVSSGITLNTENDLGEFEVEYANIPGGASYVTEFGAREKILFNGIWMPESFIDEGDNRGLSVSFGSTTVDFTFKGETPLSIPKSYLETGAWYELPDPTDDTAGLDNKRKSGVSVKFGFDEVVDLPADNPALEVTGFYGQFLTSEDTVTELEDTFVFRRVMDITDLRGSLDRYDDLSSFYRTGRWVRSDNGVPKFMTLVEIGDEYQWRAFTGTVNTSENPDVRAASAKTQYVDIEVADDEAKAIVNMIRIFKTQYVSYVNRSFSTDTDEYPDKKQVITV